MEYLSTEEDIGYVQTNCDGMVTTAPFGTTFKIRFQWTTELSMQPIG